MLRSLAPLVGCALMMLVCLVVMAGTAARARHREATAPGDNDNIAGLRDEVARLRSLDEQSHRPAEDLTR